MTPPRALSIRKEPRRHRVKVLFTGIQPTGDIHIGNYFGAIANWVRIQHDYVPFISIVDLRPIP